MCPTILVIGAFDTKGEEFAFVIRLIKEHGYPILTMDTGVFEPSKLIKPDISNVDVAEAGGVTLSALRQKSDRGWAMAIMGKGAARLLPRFFSSRCFGGIFGMGGGGGTSVIATGMRALPLGIPKVMVSTVASGNTRPYIGDSDIVMVPSIVDIAGINRISRIILTRAVGGICGMMVGMEH